MNDIKIDSTRNGVYIIQKPLVSHIKFVIEGRNFFDYPQK